jgi:sec-independent protein translocase protein TatC
MFFLAKIGIVSAKFLRSGRKYAIVIMLIISGIITPPDMLSQIICTIPLLILYEISILLCVKVEKQKKADEDKEWS